MAENDAINVRPFGYGYCHQCGRAEVVGILSVRSWQHELMVCAICLDTMAKSIREHNPNRRKEAAG